MVQGVAKFRRKFREAPKIIHERLARGLERIGDEVVAEIDLLNPLPETIKIGWTWGDAPRGSVTLGSVGKQGYETLKITIFATAATSEYPAGFPAVAAWFEFGTNLRVQKTTGREVGRITAQPYFWPTIRANKKSIRSRLQGILRRAIKKANQL
ncbi:hypothetical protein KPG71_18750 [Roseovarius sp. PS-C2]|uniref:hypothetical protein n=1 Tax=Roseovarius sp. PS-C2 TaxID=2820814 RepID=UPI001C0C38EC|nr:hypothetical protein [Roseovarius sp. PS-C2]MBU3262065.1 hypothetical protein [Roseovarius sp. PS-C2]